MRALIINPGHDGSHYQHESHRAVHRDPPPLSALAVATYMHMQGDEVEIIDTHVEPDWRYRIACALPVDYIGISVIIGQHQKNAAEITRYIRTLTDSRIVWGGVLPTALPDEVALEYGVEVFRGNIEPNWANPSMPMWSLLGERFNVRQVPYYNMVMTSRGCPYACSFCYKHEIDGAYVPRMAEDVITELEYMHELTGTKVFTFGDDNFLANRKRAHTILDYVRSRGWYIEECIGHINLLDSDMVNAMAGIVQTFIFSIETASERLQPMINKRVHLDAVPIKVKWLRDAGIACNTSFIIGLPTETDDDLRCNIDFMRELKTQNEWCRGQVYLWFPLPHTALTREAEKIYDMNLHFPIADYENANFWVRPDDPHGRYFRPYLSEKRFRELVSHGLWFKEEFKLPSGYRPYVLDRVLAGDNIDLIHDLPKASI